MQLSGKTMRSAELWLMSRSCQSATFSMPTSGVAAQHPRAARHALAEDRVALVGHGRRALLALAERLLGLAHLGALQVADLDGELLDAGADDGQGAEERGVPVALHDLVADGLDAEAELRADELLDARVDVVVGAHGAADLADGGRSP